MTTNHLCRFVLGVASWFLVAKAHAEPEIIARARAFIGDEAALSAVHSLRFVGTLVTVDPVDASKQTRASVEIVFQKPAQQRITITYEKALEQTALDDYEAWQRQQAPNDASQWRQSLLSIEQVKRLRANTYENLAFFPRPRAKGWADRRSRSGHHRWSCLSKNRLHPRAHYYFHTLL
jgi:hypothetical protein